MITLFSLASILQLCLWSTLKDNFELLICILAALTAVLRRASLGLVIFPFNFWDINVGNLSFFEWRQNSEVVRRDQLSSWPAVAAEEVSRSQNCTGIDVCKCRPHNQLVHWHSLIDAYASPTEMCTSLSQSCWSNGNSRQEKFWILAGMDTL